MRVAVLGAGAVGARIARQLLSGKSVTQIVLRDTDADRLAQVSKSLGDRVIIEHAPFNSQLDAEIIVVATPSGTQMPAVVEAMEQRRPVISTSDSLAEMVELLKFSEQAQKNNTPVILGAGFAPGLTCVLASHGAAWFDKVQEIHIAKVGTGGPSCALVHHRALSRISYDWRHDNWVRRPGGSGRSLCWFPEPIGPQDCYRAALASPVLLHHAFPEVSWITARVSASLRDRLTAPLPMLSPPHSEGGLGAVRVEIHGQKGASHEVSVLGIVERPAVAAATVAALATEYVIDGELKIRGMAGLSELVEPIDFLHGLEKRGLNVQIFEGDYEKE